MRKQMENISIENAELLKGPFLNFSGKANKYNREGDRNFCIVIEDPEFAESLINDGWNIKTLTPKDEQDDPLLYLPVACKYGDYPPEIWLVQGHSKTLLDEDSINCLDYAEIENVDIIINPYHWGPLPDGAEGIKAYVKKMWVTIAMDDFASKYEFDD